MQLKKPIELSLKDKLNYLKNLTMKNNISIPNLQTYKPNCNKLKKQQIIQVWLISIHKCKNSKQQLYNVKKK
jgi:hypothetical protein